MLKKVFVPIHLVHVPAKRTKTLDSQKVIDIAEDILEHGQKTPIQMRADGESFVLIEGYHRLEAMRALGEEVIAGYLVRVRLH